MQLFKAHRQWATRPADERFETLEDLYAATKAYADEAAEAEVAWRDIRTEAIDGEVQIVGRTQQPALLTHWAMGQLSQRVGAPADYLRRLPATLAVQNLNHGLRDRSEGQAGSESAQLLLHANDRMLVRAVTSDRYARIWNHEVAERILGLIPLGWEPARPDTGRTLNPSLMGGADLANVPNAALYASDHDIFAFIRHSDRTIREVGTPEPLYRGVIFENSEVGASALKATRFLYRYMCGNHIIWGASEVLDFSVRHVGQARERMREWEVQLRKYADSSASDEEAMIADAKRAVIADTKEGVLDKLFGIRGLNVSQKTLAASYDATVPDQDGSPNTVWGIAQGMTRHSQTIAFADQRTALDRAAGKVLRSVRKIAF